MPKQKKKRGKSSKKLKQDKEYAIRISYRGHDEIVDDAIETLFGGERISSSGFSLNNNERDITYQFASDNDRKMAAEDLLSMVKAFQSIKIDDVTSILRPK